MGRADVLATLASVGVFPSEGPSRSEGPELLEARARLAQAPLPIGTHEHLCGSGAVMVVRVPRGTVFDRVPLAAVSHGEFLRGGQTVRRTAHTCSSTTAVPKIPTTPTERMVAMPSHKIPGPFRPLSLVIGNVSSGARLPRRHLRDSIPRPAQAADNEPGPTTAGGLFGLPSTSRRDAVATGSPRKGSRGSRCPMRPSTRRSRGRS